MNRNPITNADASASSWLATNLAFMVQYIPFTIKSTLSVVSLWADLLSISFTIVAFSQEVWLYFVSISEISWYPNMCMALTKESLQFKILPTPFLTSISATEGSDDMGSALPPSMHSNGDGARGLTLPSVR